MAHSGEFILGEFTRSIDERFRVSVPAELIDPLGVQEGRCTLAKERPGCLSLWSTDEWTQRLQSGVDLVRGKMRAGKLEGRLEEVQRLGRLLSTRHRDVALAGRGRLLIPEGFREFLAVEPGSDVVLVGAAVCIEIWNPNAWLSQLEGEMPEFRKLLDALSG